MKLLQTSGGMMEPTQQWSNRRLNAIKGIVNARTYLEIGIFRGDTFLNMVFDHKVGVDPSPQFDLAKERKSNVEVHAVESDKYFQSLAVSQKFDLVFVDGLHTFAQTYRDVQNVLIHSHDRTVMLIDDTVPMDVYSSLQNQQKAIEFRKKSGNSVLGWHGDVYKTIFALHDFHPSLNFRTITKSGNSQTLVWKSKSGTRKPRFNSFEAIDRIDYFGMHENIDVMKCTDEQSALKLLASELS